MKVKVNGVKRTAANCGMNRDGLGLRGNPNPAICDRRRPDLNSADYLLFRQCRRTEDVQNMKFIFLLAASFGLMAGARADLTMQQQISVGTNRSLVTIKVQGTKIRVDLYAGQPQAVSTIKDFKTGESLTLLHRQKIYLRRVEPPAKTTVAMARPRVRFTGKTQKLGGYDTDIYTWTNARGMTGFFWVARNYPDFGRIKAEMAVLDNTASGLSDGRTPALSTLPGMVLNTQVTGGGETLMVTLISAKEKSLDAADFRPPANYHPALLPNQTTR